QPDRLGANRSRRTPLGAHPLGQRQRRLPRAAALTRAAMTEIAGARHVSRRGGPRHPGHPLARAAAVLHSEQVTATPSTLGRLALGGALASAGPPPLRVARRELPAPLPPA